MARQITIAEMEVAAYGQPITGGAAGAAVGKADDPFLTSTTGVRNTIYGAYAWVLENLEFNPFSIIPKYAWGRSGWRALVNKPTRSASTTVTKRGGTAEAGAIGETVKPTYAELETRPKVNHIPLSVSTVQEWLGTNSEDDTIGTLGGEREHFAVFHKENLAEMVTADIEKQASDATGDYTGNSLEWESYDRLIASAAEETALGGAHSGWYNPYGLINRDGGSNNYDATVSTASETDTIGGANGQLTEDLLYDFLMQINIRGGGDPNVLLGSHEIYREMQTIFSPKVRYEGGSARIGETNASVDVNGVQTNSGYDVGITVSSFNGIPYIPTRLSPKNQSDASEVGRLLALDTSDPDMTGFPTLGAMIARPTDYAEATSSSPVWPFITGGFTEEALYWTMGDIVCRNFKRQGKLRDISL